MLSCGFLLRAGVLFDSLNFWGNFSCSVEGEKPDGINDVGWRWVFELFLEISCSAVPFHFARAGVLFDSVNFWGNFWCSVEAEKLVGINDVGWSWVFGFFLRISCAAVPFHFARAGVYLIVWTFGATSYAQRKPRYLMASTMLAEVEFLDFSWTYHAQLFLFNLRVRVSYLTVWTFEATFYAQWKPRNLLASAMLAEVEFSDFSWTYHAQLKWSANAESTW